MTPDELKQLENDLWKSADDLRANSSLKSSEYATPVLGLIFLRFVDNKFRQYKAEIQQEYEALQGGRREKPIHEIALAKCGFYLPDHARYDYLLTLPGKEDIAQAIKRAMATIEEYKPELAGVLPQDEYFRLAGKRDDGLLSGDQSDGSNTLLQRLLKNFSDIPVDATGDMFGQIYQYFLRNFALAEGQGGGEFFTPDSVVRLMVEIVEPRPGKLFDPACGSGGMFVWSGKYIQDHAEEDGTNPNDFVVYGQEKTLETVKLAKMNIAINGIRGHIQQANTYYEDVFNSFEAFNNVLANPPFNVDDVNLSRVKADRRFNTYGVPQKKTKTKKKDEGKETVPNANYLWINLFATSLMPEDNRAGLVMANSASDARHSEADIRQTLIEQNLIYAMLTLPSNMFYTVTLPATLWFFDKGKVDEKILFIDARNVFTQIDRAHREFIEEQVLNLGMISHLRRGKRHRFVNLVARYFRQGMERLWENQEQVKPVSAQLIAVLDEDGDRTKGKEAAVNFLQRWDGFQDLETQYRGYAQQHIAKVNPSRDVPSDADSSDSGEDRSFRDLPALKGSEENEASVDELNQAQHELSQAFEPFFAQLHKGLKQLDKTIRAHETALIEKAKQESGGKRTQIDRQVKELKATLEELHRDVKSAESYFGHIRWLQERFPAARYEDVTGLCKLATTDEVKEQDYSLNPGRYVGVVIEEDGKTEEEFIDEILDLNQQLEKLNREAHQLERVIAHNVKQISGEGD
ncbi:MAG: type I restriction-modification system subunit M [Thainema sp.]